MLEPPAGPFAPHQWFALLRACREHGLVTLLAAAFTVQVICYLRHKKHPEE